MQIVITQSKCSGEHETMYDGAQPCDGTCTSRVVVLADGKTILEADIPTGEQVYVSAVTTDNFL